MCDVCVVARWCSDNFAMDYYYYYYYYGVKQASSWKKTPIIKIFY